MEFSATFGAVGDFISIGLLIREIVSALDDARGSAKEYRGLIQSLNILNDTLTEVDKAFDGASQVSDLATLRALGRRIAGQIKTSLTDFQAKIHKFGPSLSQNGSGNFIKDVARKVQWRLEEKDVEKFRAEIGGYSGSLQILLESTVV
jgi:hypothetical protein